jgi:RNA polymerase sigma-70 factor (ECF subfamily)
VLAVVYRIYNEGYAGRTELSAEALRLGRLLAVLMPDEPEVHGLLALMEIQHARQAARFTGGDLVLLADQDRSLWDMAAISTARVRLDRGIALRGRGPYVLQAAIASLQIEPEPDWTEIAELYAWLGALTGSPVVVLNHAVAVAEAGDPLHALALVDALALQSYSYFHSVRAELLRRLGRPAEAVVAFRAAPERAGSEPERRFLERRLAEL